MTSRGPRNRATTVSLLIFFTLLIATVAATAQAAEDESTPVSVLIGDAVAEYDAGHFQEARALFRQAHERQPTARTLRGIGMCSFELRDYVEATRSLGASLRETRRPLTNEQKRHAELLLARAHTFVGRFTMKIKPANASLFVDGHPAELEPDGVMLLSFGRHQLSLRCARARRPRRNRRSPSPAASTGRSSWRWHRRRHLRRRICRATARRETARRGPRPAR